MNWELVKQANKRSMRVGAFCVKGTTFNPKMFEGLTYSWYLDRKTLVGKLQVEKNGLKSVGTTVTVPQDIVQTLKDEQFVLFIDENAIYVSSYKRGQDALEKALKLEGVAFSR